MEYDVLKRTLSDKVSLIVIILFMLLLFVCGSMTLVIYQGTTRTETPASTTREGVPADSIPVQRKDSTTVVRKPNAWG